MRERQERGESKREREQERGESKQESDTIEIIYSVIVSDTPFTKLPAELSSRILKYLNLREFTKFLQTSKGIHVMCDTENWWAHWCKIWFPLKVKADANQTFKVFLAESYVRMIVSIPEQ